MVAPKKHKNIKRKRVKPQRADVAAVGLLHPGTARNLSDHVLVVNDDNYKWLPEASVDLVLTDPPFNIARDTNFHTYDGNTINSYRFDGVKGWDSYEQEDFLDMLKQWAGEFNRVLRPGGSFAIFCADAYVSHLIDALKEVGLSPRRTLTWQKPNAVPVNRKTMMMSACEYVVVGVKGSKATFNADLDLSQVDEGLDIEQVLVANKAAAVVEKAVRDAVASVVQSGRRRPAAIERAVKKSMRAAVGKVGEKVAAMYVEGDGYLYLRGCVPNQVSFNSKAGSRLHPTEKPVPLLRYLVKLLSNPGDLILDPFAGSGSTGEAAETAGRNAVLVERDSEYFDKASTRLKAKPLE